MAAPAAATPPPEETKTVVSVGRIDPLKDVHTMLRTAAEVLRHVPDATFLHYGPVTPGEEAYGRSCRTIHAEASAWESDSGSWAAPRTRSVPSAPPTSCS